MSLSVAQPISPELVGAVRMPASPARRSAGPWRRAWRRLRRDRLAMAGGALLLAIAAVAVLVPLAVPIDPYRQSLRDSLLPPGSPGHLLGTDHLGRDVLLRAVDGARVSLKVGFISVGISCLLGGAVGLVAGYFGGRPGAVLMRLMDVQLAFPGILAALVIVTVLGNGLDRAMIAVGLGAVPRYARVVRGCVLASKYEPFVEAARSLGASDLRIMLLHVLPQVTGPVLTLATLGLAVAILASASLSFLGLGAQPPTAEWGLMLSEGRRYLRIAPWLAIVPGAAIMATVMAINLLGDGVRDALDPRLSTKTE